MNKENFREVDFQKFYNAINPEALNVENGLVYFNTSEDNRDNAYPQKLLDLYKNGSSVHSNFIGLKKNLIYSTGLVPLSANTETVEFLNKKNKMGETIDDVFMKAALDYAIHETLAMMVIYNQEGGIAEVYHQDPSKIRASVPNKWGYVENYYYSDNWADITNKRKRTITTKNSAVKIPTFNPENGIRDGRQLLWCNSYAGGQNIYSIPSYQTSMNYIELSYYLSEFHKKKVQQGFYPSGMLLMKNNPDDESKDRFVNQFIRDYQGSSQTGKLIFMWDVGADNKPEILRMDSDPNADLYETLNAIVAQEISTAHSAHPELAGVVMGSGQQLGGQSNLINTMRLAFIENTIKPMQRVMLKGFNKIMDVNGLSNLTIINQPLRIEVPIQSGNELTADEKRDILFGLPPLNNNEETEDTVQ